jgi:GT2 family glycosyltransferase
MVVDNASRDNSHELIPRAYPSVSFIYNPVNLGFAGGNNVALRKIIAGGTDAVLLLNNDAVIGEELVMHLLAKLRDNPRLGMVGPLLEEQQGSRRIIVAGGRDMARYPRTRIVRNSAIPEGRDGQPVYPADVDSLSEVDYVPGAAVMIRTDVLRKIGLFDEDYFFSGEMADLCRRAHEAGWTCAVLQDALAIHQPAGGSLRDTLYLYYSLRNRFLFVRKHESESRRLLSAFWFVCGILMAILAFVRGRPARMRAVWLALCDGLAGRYGNRNCLFGV